MRRLAPSLNTNGCVSLVTAESWVNSCISIASSVEQNLSSASGLWLETVDDLVRDPKPGGTAWECHGTTHGPSPSVAAASSSDGCSHVHAPAEWSVAAWLSWYVCLGKTRGGAESFVLCGRVHDSQLLNLALKHDMTPKSYRRYCSCKKRYEPHWAQLVQLKMINASRGLQEDLFMRVAWPDWAEQERGAVNPLTDVYHNVQQVVPPTCSLLIEDPTWPGQLMLRSQEEFEALPLFSWWEVMDIIRRAAHRTAPLAVNPGTFSACQGEAARGSAAGIIQASLISCNKVSDMVLSGPCWHCKVQWMPAGWHCYSCANTNRAKCFFITEEENDFRIMTSCREDYVSFKDDGNGAIWIKYIFVREEQRRQGLARWLLQRVQCLFPDRPLTGMIKEPASLDENSKLFTLPTRFDEVSAFWRKLRFEIGTRIQEMDQFHDGTPLTRYKASVHLPAGTQMA